MGEVYEVIPPKCCNCEDRRYDDGDFFSWSLDVTDWDGSHILLAKAPGDYVLFVSEVGMRWIEKHAKGWLKFGLAETES